MITELARAKINLTLRILGRRPDGYHELESLVTFADVGDVITLTPDAAPGVSVSGPFAADIVGENLVTRALAAVAAAAPGLRSGHVHIEKILPVASGIGGGSADAAAVLRALRRLNADHAAEIDWRAIAARLGADVTACLESRPLRMRGLGDVTEPAAIPCFCDAVLVTPRLAVPSNKTATVYRALNAAPLAAPVSTAGTPSYLDSHATLHHEIRNGRNDLQEPALDLMPEIRAVLRALRELPGADVVRLSGSGPTCFALLGTTHSIDIIDAELNAMRAAHPDWWIAPTELGCRLNHGHSA